MYTYLIIDDETLIRKGTMKKLSSLEHLLICCGEADNGKEGIDMIKSLSPDFVILDMQMPVMDGMELLPYLSEHFPEIPLIVISGYQNFDYLKQAIQAKAIDYILKPFSREEIQKVVLSVLDSLANKTRQKLELSSMLQEKEVACYTLDLKLLENLIMGYEITTPEFGSKRLSFLNHRRSFVLLSLYSKETFPDPAWQDWVTESGYTDLVLCFPSETLQQFRFFLLFIPEIRLDTRPYILRFLDSFSAFAKQQDLCLNLGISNVHNTLTQLPAARLETCEALNSQEITVGLSGCFFFQDILSPLFITWEKEDEFLFRIESGKAEEVAHLTDELFAYYLKLPHCTLTDVKRHCEQLSIQCAAILNYYLNQQGEPHKPSSNMQAVVNTLFSLEDVKQYYLQFFLNITNLLQSKSVYLNRELIDRIQIYIQRNYQKNLTQDFLASLFFLNRSYLSQLFKKKTGQKFVDYLNDVRIEKAKELLLNSDRKMYQVAKAVGYSNTKYFFRIFKKRTSLSPEEYRNQNL